MFDQYRERQSTVVQLGRKFVKIMRVLCDSLLKQALEISGRMEEDMNKILEQNAKKVNLLNMIYLFVSILSS